MHSVRNDWQISTSQSYQHTVRMASKKKKKKKKGLVEFMHVYKKIANLNPSSGTMSLRDHFLHAPASL